MNLTRAELSAQYRRAAKALPFVHDVERRWGLPPYTLFAVGSREVDWDLAYLHGKTGDFGYGHGPWQLDNHPQNWTPQRQADCDRIDSGDMLFAADKAAEMLVDERKRCGSEIGMYNAYNHGGCGTAGTAGNDYGPDTAERRAVLEQTFGPPPRPRRKDDDEMPQIQVQPGKCLPIQYDGSPGVIQLWSDDVNLDASGEYVGHEGSVVRIAFGNKGDFHVEELVVLPKQEDQRWPLPTTPGGASVCNKGPNPVSVYVKYDGEP